jgi:hypothetical protein
MSHFSQGFESELASFITQKDLDIRADAASSQKMRDLMTKASNDVEICAQHGVECEQGAIVIKLNKKLARRIAGSALECRGLHLQGDTVMCTLPVLFKFEQVDFALSGVDPPSPAPAESEPEPKRKRR